MKYSFLFSFILLIACQSEAPKEEVVEAPKKTYPEALQKVFENHGGIEQWQKMQFLSFEMVEEEGNEQQFTHLKDRREKIVGPNFSQGFDGKNIWLDAPEDHKGNALFYHNLMFYFYAMPFILADDGIIYSETETITFDSIVYPGIKISYQAEVGSSPDDEYILHYHPETYEMAWLGYTATYFSKEKSDNFRWIRYNDWGTFNGLKLPKSITWYNVENGERIDPRSTVTFDKIEITENAPDDSFFAMPENATIMNDF